jgi:predicted permease
MYARLVRALPGAFRREYGDAMIDFFRDRVREASARAGARGVGALWLRTIPDLVSTAFNETIRRPDMVRTATDDLRFAGRLLRKNPGFTAVAVAVVALGTGAVSTIFSVANGTVLRPIPAVEAPRDLAWIHRSAENGQGSLSASYPYYEYLATHTKTMSGIASWTMQDLTVRTAGQGIQVLGNIVSAGFFETLGTRPFLGRFFAGDETQVEGAFPVVVVSHSFWTRELGADSTAIGRKILVNGAPFTVIGVTPPRFAGLFPVLRTDVFVPLMMNAQLRPTVGRLRTGNASFLEVFGRLKPDVSREQARHEIAALTKQYAQTSPVESNDLRGMTGARLEPVTGFPPGAFGPILGFMGVLLAVSALVLLIASLNVASMLLARATVRRREIAVRLAMGASAWRLVRQLLIETVVLFSIGGAAGVMLAIWGTRLVTRIDLPTEVPMQIDVAPDARVLVVTLAVAFITGIVFGLAPAIQASRTDLRSELHGGTAGAGKRRSRARNGMLVAQVAMSVLLLAAAGLFTRALTRARNVDVGFDRANVAVAALNPGSAGYDAPRARAFYRDLRARLQTVPGVQAVSFTRIVPLTMSSTGRSISIDGVTPPGGRPGGELLVSTAEVGAEYFRTMRQQIVRGRDFAASDEVDAPHVAVVNETFSKQHFPGGDAMGKVFRMDTTRITIVGVVRNAKHRGLTDPDRPFVYFPLPQLWSSAQNVLVRTAGDPAAIAPAIQSVVSDLDPNLPAPLVTTMERASAVSLLPQRAAASVTGALGFAGLLLAAVGLYGVLAFWTAQRTREMGVRLALGAAPADVRRLVVTEGMRVVAIGVAIGIALAMLATRLLRPFLFGVSPTDPLTFALIVATLGAAALLASWLPARRAAAVDPMSSLRQD